MFAPLQRLQGLKGFNPPKPTQLPQASFNLPELSATAPSSKSLNLNNNSAPKTNESPQTESVSSAPSENTLNNPKPSNNSTNSNFKSYDLSGIKVKDEVEWGAKFAEPPEGLLDKIVSPTGSNQVNSPTVYRDIPTGTSGFNISKATGKQINFGADFAAEKGKPLINPFTGDAKVVKPLGLSGAGNAVRLEYTTEDGQKVYADLNHNDTNKVKVGQTVKAGEIVATAGASGNTQGVHSDFSLYSLDKNNKPIYFDTSGKKW